jgi:flagellar basal-body rod protein FlgF/flagellar basal-body rod protein FlgG
MIRKMPYGLYLSAAGAEAQSQRIEVLANNLANVDTVGFKRDMAVLQASHSEAIEQGEDVAGSGSINDIGGGVFVRETLTEFAPGPVTKTGAITDMAIDGEGFFVVSKDDESMLTRAGNFSLTADGRLVTQEGFSVLASDGQPVVLNAASGEPLRVRSDGVLQQGATQIALALVKPASAGDLVKAGQTLFRPLADTIPLRPDERKLRSGYLEASSVKPTLEMMELIEASRAFEANVRLIQHQDEMLASLINRVLRTT